MNRPVLVTGLALAASGFVLVAGLGLVVGANEESARLEAAHDRDVAQASADEARADEQARTDRDAALDRIRQLQRETARERQRTFEAAAEHRARVEREQAERQIREWDSTAAEAARNLEVASLAVDTPATTIADGMRPVREAVLTGDIEQIRTAVARHNENAQVPIVLSDDAELGRRGIQLRARYNRHDPVFSVTLEASAASSTERCVVLVAPGSIVKASSGYQDTAPIQARFIEVRPSARAEAPATICCAGIHSDDPRPTTPKGIVRHPDVRVAKVAATAERINAEWGPAQVAIWAVANDATFDDVARAPGDYVEYVSPARDVLEAAGVDTNKLPLYSHAAPIGRRDGLGVDFGRRFQMPRGG